MSNAARTSSAGSSREASARIFIAGHRGLVGSAIFQRLRYEGYGSLITRTHAALDLERQAQVESFFEAERPDCVFLAAARVGGIWANAQGYLGSC